MSAAYGVRRIGRPAAEGRRGGAHGLLGELVEAREHRLVALGDALVARRGLVDRAQQRAVAMVGRHRGGDRRSDGVRSVLDVRAGQGELGLEQLPGRLPRGRHQQVGEVVEVAVEERAADAGLGHDLLDAEVRPRAPPDELGGRADDPLARLLAVLARLAPSPRGGHGGSVADS